MYGGVAWSSRLAYHQVEDPNARQKNCGMTVHGSLSLHIWLAFLFICPPTRKVRWRPSTSDIPKANHGERSSLAVWDLMRHYDIVKAKFLRLMLDWVPLRCHISKCCQTHPLQLDQDMSEEERQYNVNVPNIHTASSAGGTKARYTYTSSIRFETLNFTFYHH